MANAKVVFISDDVAKTRGIVAAIKSDEWRLKVLELDGFDTLLPLEGPDVVIFDTKERDLVRNLDFLSDVKVFDDNIPVIFIAENGKIEDVVSLMRDGAFDYFVSPLDEERLKIAVANAIRLYKLTKRIFLLEQSAGWDGKFDNIVGQSAKMQEVFRLISTVAKSNATVLVLGKSGTGKEMVAKAIHNHSKRAKKPFIDINCGAIPRELLENELFGHERGAYTGADRRYIGSCERADGGTLFLDEICEMDPSLQVKLLRLLQERSLNRVGGVETIKVDIRFIAATNKNIEEEVQAGRFREDLFYRLNVVPLLIPPLKDRKEDLALLAKYFISKYSERNEKIFVDLSPEAGEAFQQHDWPGNVRELENVIERAVVLNNDSLVKVKHLPPHLQQLLKERKKRVSAPIMRDDMQKIIPLDLVEKYAIESALDKCGGNVSETAKQLKIGQATLYRKIKQYGLKDR